MLHLFNSVYICHDYLWTGRDDFIMASPEGGENHYLPGAVTPLEHSMSFQELLDDHFEGDVEKLWEKLHTYGSKIVVYLTDEDHMKMAIQFYKSILKNPSADAAYMLYKTKLESMELGKEFIKSKLQQGGAFSKKKKMPTKETFVTAYNQVDASQYLLDNLNTATVGFELLLANYLHDENNKHANVFLNRVSKISWEQWIEEMEQLKIEILAGILDADKLNNAAGESSLNIPKIDPELPIIPQLKVIPELSWIVDPEWHVENPNYIKQQYDADLFCDLYDAIYAIWSSGEDMREICHAIIADDPKTLLERDIARNHSCVFTANEFRGKMNFVFCNLAYRYKRENSTDKLAAFELR